MSCFGCNQQIDYDKAKRDETIKQAQVQANQTGEWFALYRDGKDLKSIRADIAKELGIIPEGFITPKL